MNFLPFQGLPHFVSLAIKIVFFTGHVQSFADRNLKLGVPLNELDSIELFPLPPNVDVKQNVGVENVFILDVEPQRDAPISSSNMKPVKWVWWNCRQTNIGMNPNNKSSPRLDRLFSSSKGPLTS
jgi:hypothetical protein